MGNDQSSRAVPETGVVEELRVERITQKYLRRYPNSKRTRSWAGCMVHISTDRGVWRTNAEGYTYRGRADAWVLPFEEAQKQVAHCGPEKEASFIKVCAADALDGLGNASDAHVSPEVWRLHGCEYAVTSARSVLSSVQPVSGSREQRGNEEGSDA